MGCLVDVLQVLDFCLLPFQLRQDFVLLCCHSRGSSTILQVFQNTSPVAQPGQLGPGPGPQSLSPELQEHCLVPSPQLLSPQALLHHSQAGTMEGAGASEGWSSCAPLAVGAGLATVLSRVPGLPVGEIHLR